MKIRFAEKKDKKSIIDLIDELVEEAYKKTGTPVKHTDKEKRYALFEAMVQKNDFKFFVAEEDGKLLGLAQLSIVPILRRGYYQGVIENFIITKTMRGKGIGSSLIKQVINYCKQNNLRVIKLTSAVEMTRAHNFYEKQGGKFTERMYRFDLD